METERSEMADGSPVADREVYGLTDRGHVRTENQDHFLICLLGAESHLHATSVPAEDLPAVPSRPDGNQGLLLAVADGVGGGPGGEDASRAVLADLPGRVLTALQVRQGSQGMEAALTTALLECHRHLVRLGEERMETLGMATTLTAWLEVGEVGWLMQVGDSRCYRLRDGTLEQLSRDQTVAQQLVEQGLVGSLAEAPRRWRNILVSAVGGGTVKPVVTPFHTRPGDRVLLATDGLPKHLTPDEIAAALGHRDGVAPAARRLLEETLRRGGNDNLALALSGTLP